MSGRRYIGSIEWSSVSAGRIGVYRIPGHYGWMVCDESGHLLPMGRWVSRFDTHADAITYAHEQATRQAVAARFNIPPENPVARAIQEPTC